MTGEYEKISDFPMELRLDDQIGPAAHITRGKADAMIEGALLAAGFGANVAQSTAHDEIEIEVEAEPITSQRRRRPVALWQAVAAAVVAFAGIGSASAAVMWFAKQQRPTPVVEQLEERAKKPSHKAKRVASPVEAPVIVAEPEPIVEELAVEPSLVEKPKHVRERKPEDFLEEANQLRARKKWKEADEVYAKVWQTAPKSDAAYVARIAAAGIRLDHLGDPKTALVRYRAALKASSRGVLSEEARFGIAEAFRKLDDQEREVMALREFLIRHPDAGLAPKAKARLSALGEAL